MKPDIKNIKFITVSADEMKRAEWIIKSFMYDSKFNGVIAYK